MIVNNQTIKVMIIMGPKKAFSIFFVTTLLAISIFVAGCTDIKPEPQIEDTVTPTDTDTATTTSTFTGTATPEPTVVEKVTAVGTPQIHNVLIKSYLMVPVDGKIINVGDNVQWRNREDNKHPRILISEDGIWEGEQSISYMKTVNYTFTEHGVYTFYLKGKEANKWNITVV